MGDPSDPLSLNRYVYCNLDPVNFVDPTGFSTASIARAGYSFAGILGCIPGGQIFAVVVAGAVTGFVVAVIMSEAWDSVNEGDVIVTDPFGNSIPVRNGERVEGSPDGKTWQKKDKNGNPTGDRYDGKGHPKQKDPKAQVPHAHRVGPDGQPITDPQGNPHLPANS